MAGPTDLPPRAPLGARLPALARIALGVAILAAFQLAGERVAAWTHAPIPGSVLGMVLLTTALATDVLPMRFVREAADLLLRHLVLFYIPAGVGLMAYAGVFRRAWLPITVGGLASLLAVLVVVGRTCQSLDRAPAE